MATTETVSEVNGAAIGSPSEAQEFSKIIPVMSRGPEVHEDDVDDFAGMEDSVEIPNEQETYNEEDYSEVEVEDEERDIENELAEVHVHETDGDGW